MNLNDYRVRPTVSGDAFQLYHAETNEVLITTMNIGIDTLLRLALDNDLGV